MIKTIRPATRKSFAGTRDFGIEIRTLVEEALHEGEPVEVDLTGIEDMTPSFADECFGKLSEQYGLDITEGKVRLLGGEQFRPLIEGVTRLRLQRRKPSTSNTPQRSS